MKKRSAFTMIELVMVIVVFGIVASIGAEIITSLYTNYLRTRAINQLQSQTEITLEQIAKRLQYRIKDSVRAKANGAAWVSLPNAIPGDNIIEWIGISNESFLGEWDGVSVVPGWSGLIDMEHANTALATLTLETPGSRLDFTRDTILALTNGTVDFYNPASKLPALIFKGPKTNYNVNNYYTPGVANYTLRVATAALTPTTFSIPPGDSLTDFDNDGFGDLFEQYYLSHTAYALVPVFAGGANDFNLTLRYNYQPWEGEAYDDPAVIAAGRILAEHVSTFRIRQDGDVVRIKLCIHDNNQSGSFDFSACKEKVIY